ncbi:MAG: NAD(P)-dependent oxidoreductase [Acidobacteriota bacterium]|nr:NAD(P)-dependent oxidoreductase [Acidobacteriota bacterium]
MEMGFIGLGAMGEPIARNLIKAGHVLKVYNRTRSRAEALAGQDTTVVDTPAAACTAGVVASMLADDAAVEGVVFGDNGVLAGLPRGGVHISHSTISVNLSRRLADAHRQRGQLFIAAPVFGRPDAAQAGRLIVVAAGPPEAVERCHPVLEAIGRKLFVIGTDAPAANTVKLGGNFLIASMLETLGEAVALMRKSGVDPATFLEIMVGSFFQSPVYENYGKIIAEQRYEPAGFKLRLGLKDVRLMMAAADEAGAPMPIASLIRDNLISGIAQGLGDLDWSAVARVAALKSGLKT